MIVKFVKKQLPIPPRQISHQELDVAAVGCARLTCRLPRRRRRRRVLAAVGRYHRPRPFTVHQWQGGVAMVNEAAVAMETLLGSNRPVQRGSDLLDLLAKALGLYSLVAFFLQFVFLFFVFFCNFLKLLECTVCGCIFRLLVPFKTPVHTYMPLPLPPQKHTNTVTEHVHIWILTEGFSRSSCPPPPPHPPLWYCCVSHGGAVAILASANLTGVRELADGPEK